MYLLEPVVFRYDDLPTQPLVSLDSRVSRPPRSTRRTNRPQVVREVPVPSRIRKICKISGASDMSRTYLPCVDQTISALLYRVRARFVDPTCF